MPVKAPAPDPGWIRITVEKRTILFRPDGTGRTEGAVPIPFGWQVSPDGTRAAVVDPTGAAPAVLVAGGDGKNARKVSGDKVAGAAPPSWSPDSKVVAFVALSGEYPQVHVVDRDGGNLRRITDAPLGADRPKFGPQGQLTYLLLGTPKGKRPTADLWLDTEATAIVRKVVVSDYAWSPDGKVIAYGKPGALVFHDVAAGKGQEVSFVDIDKKLSDHAPALLCWSPDGRAVACSMTYWGARQAGAPKALGDAEMFVFPREGKPNWFEIGLMIQRVEWLKDAPLAVDLRMPDGTVVVAADQIVSYDWSTHTLTLVPKAREELARRLKAGGLTARGPDRERTGLVGGIPFAVCVDGKATYTGKFTTSLSSIPMTGPSVTVDEANIDPTLGVDQLHIRPGYPGTAAPKGDDPRGDRRVRDALASAGKLKADKPTADVKTVRATGDWSEEVSGVRGRLVLAQGHTLQDKTTRESLVYVELESVTHTSSGHVNVYFDANDLKCELTDAAGKAVAQEPVFGSGGRPGKTWVAIPYDSSIRLRANPYGFGRAEGFLILLNGPAWLIKDDAEYYLTGALTISPPDGHGLKDVCKGELKLPKARITLKTK